MTAAITEAQRSSERNRRAIASAVAGLALRGSSFLVVLVTVPLTLGLLGPYQFGMWMTLAALVAFLGVVDLGIGNGVLNNLAKALGEDNRVAAREYVTSGIVALTIIAVILGVAFALSYAFVPWARLYNVTEDPVAAAEAGPATAVFVITFLVGLPLGLAAQARSAFQEGFIQSGFQGFGNVLTLGFLAWAVASRATLPWLVLAVSSGPLVAAAASFGVLVWQRRWIRPRRIDVTRRALRAVTGVGLAFLVLQIAYTIAFTSDSLIVAQVIGPAAVADYSVVRRLFAIPAGLAAIAVVPLWPAYREALTRSDLRWVRSTLRRSVLVVLVVTIPIAVGLTFLGPLLMDAWTQGTLSPDPLLYPALAASTVAFALANTLAVLFNGAQAMRFQIITMTLMAIVNVTSSVYLASRIGVAGVALGSVIAICAALIIPGLIYLPGLLRRLDRPRAPMTDAPLLDVGRGLHL